MRYTWRIKKYPFFLALREKGREEFEDGVKQRIPIIEEQIEHLEKTWASEWEIRQKKARLKELRESL